MKKQKTLFITTIVCGSLSLVTFVLERLALTDIFHVEPDLYLEWGMVNTALVPILLFHFLCLVSAGISLRLLVSQTNRAAQQADTAGHPAGDR